MQHAYIGFFRENNQKPIHENFLKSFKSFISNLTGSDDADRPVMSHEHLQFHKLVHSDNHQFLFSQEQPHEGTFNELGAKRELTIHSLKNPHSMLFDSYPSIKIPYHTIHHVTGLDRVGDSEHAKALVDYSLSSYEINSSLIKRHIRGTGLTKYINADVNDISDAISRQKTNKDMIVHSGIGFNPLYMGHSTAGFSIMHLPAFTSTSTDPGVGYKFAKSKASHTDPEFFGPEAEEGTRHMVSLHIPTGSHALNMKRYNTNLNEREILLNKDAKVAIFKHPNIIGIRGKSIRTHHYFGVLLHDGFSPTRHAGE